MRLPRDLSGKEFAGLLGAYEYQVTRSTGSHMRLTTILGGEHHITIPAHANLRIGTISGVVSAVALHFGV